MEATTTFVILLSIAFMFGDDEFGFLPTKMKPKLQNECKRLLDVETYRSIEIAFENMINSSKSLDLSELSTISDDNYAKEVCKKSSPLFDSIGSFIVATKPCLSSAQKTKSSSLYALNKGIWGLVCSENEFRSALRCYEEKETDMADCFSGFQGCDTRSPEERIESCKEFKTDLECSLDKLRECNPPKIAELAQQFIEQLGDEKICYDFSLAQTEWLHEVGMISTEKPIV